jgi:hypothetical protein
LATKRYTVRAETDAEDDFRRALLYYAQIDQSYGSNPVLVDAFIIEYLDFCERLANNPFQFPPFEEYRKAYFSRRFATSQFSK